MVDSRHVIFRQGPAGSPGIFINVPRAGRLWDCEKTGVTRKKVQRHLSGSTVVPLAQFRKDAATGAARRGKLSMRKRAVTDDSDLVLDTVRKKLALDPASAQVVSDLVAGETLVMERPLGRPHSVEAEVANANEADLSGRDERLHRPHRLLDWVQAAPMKQIKVEDRKSTRLNSSH